jgi:peptidoglycan/xylan/chitin deacetylase (PgdA/CDA1 family)
MNSALLPHAVKGAVRAAAGLVYAATPHLMHRLEGKVLILMYHRVVPEHVVQTTFVQAGMYVTPGTFERHLAFLTAHFDVLPFDALLARWRDGALHSRTRYCAITFDDGWRDNYCYAYPLLRAYRAPATIFLPTGLVGTAAAFWPERVGQLLRGRPPGDVERLIERLKSAPAPVRRRLIARLGARARAERPAERCLVDWAEAREMSRHGIAFGAHSNTHEILTMLDDATLHDELRRPLEMLAAQGVATVPAVAYPNGNHDSRVVAAARAAGYRAALTTRAGVEAAAPADLFRLSRIGVHEDVSRSVPLLTLHVARQAFLS